MEKFGIFELLDALSALTAREEPQAETKPSAHDAAYQAPNYGSAPEPQTQKEPRPDADALAGFYARHAAVAKKAGEKK